MCHHKKLFLILSNNRHVRASASYYLPGGTALTVDENFRSHQTIDGNGTNKIGLGRWNWIWLRGKEEICAGYISVYKPCENKKDSTTTWKQQVYYFQTIKFLTEPGTRELFDNDLHEELKKWIELGDTIVLGIYMNEDARTSSLAQKLKPLQLKDTVLSLHHFSSPPDTFNWNHKRKPIEAFWVGKNVEVTWAGNVPFDRNYPASP